MSICAIILAAGRGSRMGTFTDALPKGLISFKGRSAVERQLDNLKNAGIEDIFIITGYLAHNYEALGCRTIHNSQWAASNMVFSLKHAFQKGLAYDRVIVSYADIFYASEGLAQIASTRADMAMLYDENWQTLWSSRFEDPLEDAETFRINQKAELVEIGRQPKSLGEVQGQYMGVLSFSRTGWQDLCEFISSLPLERQKSIDMTSLMQLSIEKAKFKYHCIPYQGKWGEIDTITDLELYSADHAYSE